MSINLGVYVFVINEYVLISASSVARLVPEVVPGQVLDEEPYLQHSIQDIYAKLDIKSKRALEKHRLMKIRKEERKREVSQILDLGLY